VDDVALHCKGMEFWLVVVSSVTVRGLARDPRMLGYREYLYSLTLRGYITTNRGPILIILSSSCRE